MPGASLLGGLLCSQTPRSTATHRLRLTRARCHPRLVALIAGGLGSPRVRLALGLSCLVSAYRLSPCLVVYSARSHLGLLTFTACGSPMRGVTTAWRFTLLASI
ncbi:hypothetical protein BO82DRAFT_32597 [Aspergillus uvarum CBS 121591]|uniref:Uncharacterized protein n=1 Tax=Aspergillus uvarum CBS 121591 TaxID=1448315 RepID=A0A319BVL9_9EURO|nr:hypothetical protein BO82DRAFT_32597 [Aspergillus uvarum CBS 121591]PYH75390.1 hypothetical protein BO82DRAFT_32597 [Aspergillus uvarum CBS 121591]